MLGAYFHQLFLEHLDAFAEQPAVGFQLRFAGAAHANTAALTLQVGPAADQPGRQVLELRQFHLQLANVAARALGKNIEDQAGAVDHAAIKLALQIAFLDRAQGVVEQNQRGAGIGDALGNFIDFALAGKQGCIGPLAATTNHGRHGNAAATRKQLQLFDTFGVIRDAEIKRHNDGFGAATGTLKHQ